MQCYCIRVQGLTYSGWTSILLVNIPGPLLLSSYCEIPVHHHQTRCVGTGRHMTGHLTHPSPPRTWAGYVCFSRSTRMQETGDCDTLDPSHSWWLAASLLENRHTIFHSMHNHDIQNLQLKNWTNNIKVWWTSSKPSCIHGRMCRICRWFSHVTCFLLPL